MCPPTDVSYLLMSRIAPFLSRNDSTKIITAINITQLDLDMKLASHCLKMLYVGRIRLFQQGIIQIKVCFLSTMRSLLESIEKIVADNGYNRKWLIVLSSVWKCFGGLGRDTCNLRDGLSRLEH